MEAVGGSPEGSLDYHTAQDWSEGGESWSGSEGLDACSDWDSEEEAQNLLLWGGSGSEGSSAWSGWDSEDEALTRWGRCDLGGMDDRAREIFEEWR